MLIETPERVFLLLKKLEFVGISGTGGMLLL